MRKIASLLLVCGMLVAACAGMTSCNDSTGSETTASVETTGDTQTPGTQFEIPADPLEGRTPTSAEYFEIKVDSATKTATIKAVLTTAPEDIVIPAEVEVAGEKYTVTTVGISAFAQSAAKSIYVPYTVTEIGEYAFSSCSNLKEIHIPTTVTELKKGTFSSSAIDSLSFIPASVTKLGERCFEACKNLIKDIVMPDTVTTIGKYCFMDCNKMDGIKLSANLEAIPDHAFSGCAYLGNAADYVLEIPDSVKSIGSSAFKDCTRLGYIKLPANLESIGSKAFDGCKKFDNMNIPDSVKSIGANAFDGCTRLAKIKLPANAELKMGATVFGAKPSKKLAEIFVTAGTPAETWCKENDLGDRLKNAADYTA